MPTDDTFRAPGRPSTRPRHGCAAGQRGSGNHPSGHVTKTANLAHHPLRSIGRPEHQHVQVRRPRCQVWLQSIARAVYPARAVKRAATPKAVKKATRAMHPLDSAIYGVERSVATSLRSGRKRRQRRKGRVPVYRHGAWPGGTPDSRGRREMRQPLMSSKSRAWPVVAMHQVRL